MSTYHIPVDDATIDYVMSVSDREPPVLAELREETAKLPMARMQVSPMVGQFLALLVGAIGARRILEIGTFTGYSSIAMALAMPEAGKLVALDAVRNSPARRASFGRS